MSESIFFSLFIVTSSFVSFVLFNSALNLVPKLLKNSKASYIDDSNWWKFRNILVSFCHSSISGLWATTSLLIYPQFLQDVIDFYQAFGHYAICFTEGYFFYDLLDIFLNRNLFTRSNEIIAHHSIVLTNFTITIITRRYTGAMLICLISELHNILLHLRTLTKMSKVHAASSFYKWICHLNSITLLSFRTLPYFLLFYHIINLSLTKEPILSLPILSLFWSTLLLLFIYHLVLFQRTYSQDHTNINTFKESSSNNNNAYFDSKSDLIKSAQNGYVQVNGVKPKCSVNGFKNKAH